MRRPSPRRERRRWEWRANPVELWVKSPIARWRSVCTGARVRRVVRWRGGCICRNPGWKRRRGGQRARSPRASVTGARTSWPWIWWIRRWRGRCRVCRSWPILPTATILISAPACVSGGCSTPWRSNPARRSGRATRPKPPWPPASQRAGPGSIPP